MQKQTRRFVVLSSGALQAVLLLMCVWLWSVWMEGRLTNSLADRAANQSQQLVDQLASEIADCGPDTAEIGSKAWERIDERVRIGSGDNGSFLAVLDTNSNRLTHHADLSRDIRDHVVVDAIDILQPPSADSMKWRLSFGNAGVVGRRVPGSTLLSATTHFRCGSQADARAATTTWATCRHVDRHQFRRHAVFGIQTL